MTWHRRHAGVALVSALLVVSLATIAAVAMTSRQHLDIRRTNNILDADQARLYGLGAESWARQILARDRVENNVDSLDENWAKLLFPVAVPGGSISTTIEDMQGRFNVNNLVVNGKRDPLALQRFSRLLALLELEPDLANVVVDWIDPDGEPEYPGAEDDEYLGAKPAYRTANAPMSSLSELMLVKGMTKEAYTALAPYLTALPTATPVNVNTASEQVIMCLIEGMSQSDAETLVEERGDKGFASVDEFFKHKSLAGREVTEAGIAIASDFFLVRAEANIGRVRARLNSLLHRTSSGQVTVVSRSRSKE